MIRDATQLAEVMVHPNIGRSCRTSSKCETKSTLTSKINGAGEERDAHDEQQESGAFPRAARTQLFLHAVTGGAELCVVSVVVGRRVGPGGHAGHPELRVVCG
jgi:hypothetical protein